MELTVINREELPREANSFELAGYLHGIAEVSLIWVEMSPGDQVALHQHPYGEIFVIVEGQALFTVGTTQLVAHAGQIVLAPPNTPPSSPTMAQVYYASSTFTSARALSLNGAKTATVAPSM